MKIEYKLTTEEVKQAIKDWLVNTQKVDRDKICEIELDSFIVKVDTSKRYPEGKD